MRIRIRGFTLVEVVVISAIVAILAVLSVPVYNAYVLGAREDTATNLAATVAVSAGSYFHKTGAVPTMTQLEVTYDTSKHAIVLDDSTVTVTVKDYPGIVVSSRFK